MTRILFLVFLLYQSVESLWPYHVRLSDESNKTRTVHAKSWIYNGAETREAMPSESVMSGFVGSMDADEILNGELYFKNKKLKGWVMEENIKDGEILGFSKETFSQYPKQYRSQTINCMHGNVFVQRKMGNHSKFEFKTDSDNDDTFDSVLKEMHTSVQSDLRQNADDLLTALGLASTSKTHQTCWPAHASHLHVRDNYHLGPMCSSYQYYDTQSATCQTCSAGTVPDWSSSVLQSKYDDIQYFDTKECSSLTGWEELVSRFDWTVLANPEGYYYCKEIVDTLGFMGLHGGDGRNENYQINSRVLKCIFEQCSSAIYSTLSAIQYNYEWSFRAPHPGYFWHYSPIKCKSKTNPLAPTTRGDCGDNGLFDAVEFKDFVGDKTCQELSTGQMPYGIHRIHPEYTWNVPTYTEGSKYRLLLDELWFQGPDTSELTFDTDIQEYRRSYCFNMKRDGECKQIIEETAPFVYPNETIYVSSGDLSEGGYSFYSDTECQNTLFSGLMGNYRLAPNAKYTFRRCNNSNTHPFDVSVDDTWSADGIVGNETLVVTTGGLHRVYEWRSTDYPEFMHGVFIIANHTTMLPGGQLLTSLGFSTCPTSVETDLTSNTASKNYTDFRVEDKRGAGQRGGLLLAAAISPIAAVNTIVDQRLRQTSHLLSKDMPFEEECAYKCTDLNKPLATVSIDSSGIRSCSCASGSFEDCHIPCTGTCETYVVEDAVYAGTFDNTWKNGSGYGGLQEFVGFFTPENCEKLVSDRRYNNPDDYADVNGVSSDGHRCYMEYGMKSHDKSARFKSKFFTDTVVNVGEIIPPDVTHSRVSVSDLYVRLETTNANSFSVFEDDGTLPVYNFSANIDEYTISDTKVAIELLDTTMAILNADVTFPRRVLALGVNYLGTDPFASVHVIELDGEDEAVRSLCLAGFMNKEIQKVHSIAVVVISQWDEYTTPGQSVEESTEDTEAQEQIERFSESEEFHSMNSLRGNLIEDLPKEDRGLLLASVLRANGRTVLWATDLHGIPLDNESPFIDSIDFEWSLYAVHKESAFGGRLLMAVYDEESRKVYVFDNEFSKAEEFGVQRDVGIVSDVTGSRYPESDGDIVFFDSIIGMEWASGGKLIVMTDKGVHMYTRKRENVGLVPCQIDKTAKEIAGIVNPGYRFELGDKCDIVTEKCPPGQYQDEAGQYDCKICSPGTYNDDQGQNECKDCWIGTFQPLHGQTNCDDCMPGFYSDEEGSRGLSGNQHESIMFEHTCKSCPRGYMSMEKASPDCIQCKSEQYCDIKSQIISHATCTPGNDIWLDRSDHLHELCCSTSLGHDYGYDSNNTLFGWRETDTLFCTKRRKINTAPKLENCGSFEDKTNDELEEFFACELRNLDKENSTYGYLIPSDIFLPNATESNTTDTAPIGTEWAGDFECFMETDHPTDIIFELNECCPRGLNDIIWQQGDDLRCVKTYGGDYMVGFDSKTLSLNITSETKTATACQITVNSVPTNFNPLSDEITRCCNADVNASIMLDWEYETIPFQEGSAKCYKSTDDDDCYLEFEYRKLGKKDKIVKSEIEITNGTCEDNGYKVSSANITKNVPENCSEGWNFQDFLAPEYEYSNQEECPEGWQAVSDEQLMAIYNGSCTDHVGWGPVLVEDCGTGVILQMFPEEYMELSLTYTNNQLFSTSTCRAQKFNTAGAGQELCFIHDGMEVCDVIPIEKSETELQNILDTGCSNEYPCLCQRPITCERRDLTCSIRNKCVCTYTESSNCSASDNSTCYCDEYETLSEYTTANHKTQHNKSKTYYLAEQWDAKDFDLVQGFDQDSNELYVIERTWSNVSVDPTVLSEDGSIFHDDQYYYEIEAYETNDVLIDMKGGVDWEATRGTDEFRYCRHEFDNGEKRLVNVTVFENSSDINSTLINATESVSVYDAVYCSSFFPIAKQVSQYEWTCSSVTQCPYWEYWPRPIDETGFVETDPCICNDKEEYSGYCIPDMSKWSDVIVNSTTNETVRMLVTQELWITDVDQLFVNISLREFSRNCALGNIMKSSVEYNKSDVVWWQDALDRSCMCQGQLCNAYDAHKITFGNRDLDPNDQMLTHTCASDGCIYDILDPKVWQDTEGYSEDCSNATDAVCGVYGFGRYNDAMDYQMLFGLYDSEGKVQSGIMKCPNVDASRRNVFPGSKKGIYVRDGDFEVVPNGLPAYCKCGSDYCNYGEYCKVFGGNGYCGDSTADVLDTVFRNNINVQCSCLPNTIEDLDLSEFKAEETCMCNNSTYCGQGEYCSKTKGCIECACNEGEWEEIINDKSSCKPVSNCELGSVIETPETQYSDRTCKQCVETLTYAPYPNANECVPCTACAAGIKNDCTLTVDTVCKRVCPLGQHDWHGFCMEKCSSSEHTLANGTCIDRCDYGTYFDKIENACVQCPQNHFTTVMGAGTKQKCRPHVTCNMTSHYWAELPSKSRKGICVSRYSGECVIRTPGNETTDDQCNMARLTVPDYLIESDAMQKNLTTNNNYEVEHAADLRIVREILETEYYLDEPTDIQLALVGRYLSLFGEATYLRPGV